ncbi:uncharacterized protein LOC136095184 [Hydra vulgaris]|uniref:uncharacterized protein LOC136095184 n=1 Tax=Hydra vulgaris TaxID=6087 RepID=UPI0032EA543A
MRYLESANKIIKNQLNQYKRKYIHSYENMSTDKKLFQKYTGIEHEQFINLYKFLNPGNNGENIKNHNSSLSKKINILVNEEKSGPKPKLNTKDQLYMFLVWLKNGFTIFHTSCLFKISKSTTSRYLITWTNFIYFSIGSVPIWPSREQVDKYIPENFKMTFPSTRCIIDCTELFCQKPSSLRQQSSLFSNYKHHVTYKGLLGNSPSGAITFISQLYDGSISDKEIVIKSGFLNKELWDENKSVMDNRGFTISDILKTINVRLNIPSLLNG